ncbi:alpha beta hydrolase fold family [Moniliophthora roreri MCA 2997]|uniref:Alpha beta hydrolase fold family n=1 Tax=Moniliophthora roreri (strain MCA 2997) TaxID=1381753 RepID=V2WVE9_MONRO|nr:alpha beta hydrolase fold family [Moniliophthora roreri MCA 2997]
MFSNQTILTSTLQIQPSPNLTWVACYDDVLQCALFQVPIDYSDASSGTLSIAMTKYPASASSLESPEMILYNPGGPGISGVDIVVSAGSILSAVFGPQFDVVSFDVRGTGHSTPRYEFFLNEAERNVWLGDPRKESPAATPDMIPSLWANARTLGMLARDRDVNGILPFAGSDMIARDMLSMVEAAGQEKLLYYGISYGTVLGSTFATIYPDRVERMILDGVLDMEGYYAGDGRNEVVDSDKTLQAFFDSCFAAGPDVCAYYSSSPAAIEDRLNALYITIKDSPVGVYSSSSPYYGLVDYPTLKRAVQVALYNPYTSFAPLAQGLADLENGNGTTIYGLQVEGSEPSACGAAEYSNDWEANHAVTCGDGEEVTDNVEDLKKYWEETKDISTLADAALAQRIMCSGWKVHREGRFLGPVGANTSFPILLIGNTADPVTPLSAAKKTSTAFPGSVVLTLDTPGHTSVITTSFCLYEYIGAYFANGTLPEKGTVCEVDATIFPAV